jgi:AcrR family transcriptional regulator
MVPKAEPEPTTVEASPPASRGRPRAVGRTDEILRVTTELVDEVGYDQLRIQDVADRAGAGLATIYRRWPTKQALVADAIRHKSLSINPEPTGDPVTDLSLLFRSIAEHACGHRAKFLPGLFAAVRTEPELGEAFRTFFVEGIRARVREQIALLLGADHPNLDLLADLVPGVLLFRSLVPGTPEIDPEQFVAEALSVVLGCARPADVPTGAAGPA